MKSLVEFKSIVEEEKSDYTKFDVLVRAGLANKAQMQRIHKILDKMGEEKPVFNNADRMIIQNLFNRMVDLISNNKQIYTQAKRAVREDVDVELTEEPIVLQEDKDPPMVLVIKRKAIRMYPDGTRIALYFNQRLNKYFSVPYKYGEGIDAPIQAEEVEQIDEIRRGGFTAGWRDEKYFGKGVPTNRPMTDKEKVESQKTKDIQSYLNNLSKNRLKKEDVELEEAVMDTLHKIVKDKQAKSVKFASGHSRKVDHFTASAITQVHSAVNDENKKKLADMVHKSPAHFEKVASFAFSKAK
jgi:hypothetical protein